jgi:hypothetical protein
VIAAVFLYGTLLDPAVFRRFAGRRPPALARTARLAGHRRVALRGTPYPTLLRAPGAVDGLLIPRLAPAAFLRLVRYEGASYRLAPVSVSTARGKRRARAWIAPCRLADTTRDWHPGLGRWQPRANVSAVALAAGLEAAGGRRAATAGES